jgi:regulation of enolase protein 1 (concanavalin A-like superfamily)
VGEHAFVADGYNGLSIISVSSAQQVDVKVDLEALSQSGSPLATFAAGSYEGETPGWERFGLSAPLPPETKQARLLVRTSGADPITYLDDIAFGPAPAAPPAPLPAVHTDGDIWPTRRPKLEWMEVSAATSFELQVALDAAFAQMALEAATASPFYAASEDLELNRRYFWRVRAANGAGRSGWSPTRSFILRPASEYHDDEFDAGALRDGWTWVREDPSRWGFWGTRGVLAISTQAGELAGAANTARNLLLRPAPTGDFEASTDVSMALTASTQQGGLLVYLDDDNYLKAMRIMTDAPGVELRAEVNGMTVQQSATLINTGAGVPLRIARQGDSYSAYYSTDGMTWRALGQPVSVDWDAPRVGLTAYSQAGVAETAAYFTWFRVRPGCAEVTIEVMPPGSGIAGQGAGDCDGGTGHSAGFMVTASAQPAPGFVFDRWGGAIGGTENPAHFVIQQDMYVVANFSPETHAAMLFLPFLVTE